MMKKIMVSVLVLFMLLGCQSKASTDFTVGVLQWAEHPALTDSYTGMVKGLKEAGLKDRVNVIYKNANEDVGTASQIVSQFVQEGVDVSSPSQRHLRKQRSMALREQTLRLCLRLLRMLHQLV